MPMSHLCPASTHRGFLQSAAFSAALFGVRGLLITSD